MTSLLVSTALADVKIDSIGSLSSDVGLSTLRGAEIAVKEINATGGVSGEKLALVSADTGKDITKGVKAYEYLTKTKEADFIISGPIDDVGLSRLLRMREFQIPTLDTWTSYIGTVDMVIESPETMTPHFMNIASDEALAALYISFGTDMPRKGMGWDSVVILAEGTTFGGVIIDPTTGTLGPVAGIETKEIIIYDIGTANFVPPSSKARASGADFIYQVNSVNSRVTSSQYVKLQMPMAITGVNVSALGLKYWEGTGGAGDDAFTLSLILSVGLGLDLESQKFVDTYQVKYDSCPKMSHFNGFNAYWGLRQAVAVVKATGGLSGAKVWSAEVRKQDITPKKDGKMRLHYAFWSDDEVEEVTSQIYPHNARFDLTTSCDDAQPSTVVTQWKEDSRVGVAYPPEYATIKFTMPDWVE